MDNANNLLGYDGFFALRFRDLMKSANVTQKDLAEKIGVTRQAISLYMDGSIQPNIEKLFKIAEFFKVSTDYLLGNIDVKSINIEDKAIHEKLGLSDKAIETLKGLQSECLNPQDENDIYNYCSYAFIELINFLMEDYNCFDIFTGIIKFSNVSLKIFQADKLKKLLKKVMQESMPNPDLKMMFDGISFDGDEVNFTVTPEEAKYAILGKISEDLKKLVEKYSELKKKEFLDNLLAEAKENASKEKK